MDDIINTYLECNQITTFMKNVMFQKIKKILLNYNISTIEQLLDIENILSCEKEKSLLKPLFIFYKTKCTNIIKYEPDFEQLENMYKSNQKKLTSLEKIICKMLLYSEYPYLDEDLEPIVRKVFRISLSLFLEIKQEHEIYIYFCNFRQQQKAVLALESFCKQITN
jgi:hypothetical protein